MDQVVDNQFVKFDEIVKLFEDLLKCMFLDHRWRAKFDNAFLLQNVQKESLKSQIEGLEVNYHNVLQK